ncbi:hypothetical protein F511_46226 [Dorcoceras hygrometricum]|uniref:Uncharacterized protein n=1 Tax=Dorcoceras hygrometricum TaxID=472368 RepID=A0A2Z6ZUI7_9LAMI|nr:hypothetical protein F511_46226 [Dorcoceras hygrometricum]
MGDLMSRAGRATRAMVTGRLRHDWPSREATLGTTPRDGRRLAAESGEWRCAAGCTMMRAAVRRARALLPPRFFRGGGRRPAATLASFRRCRDGWSDSF